MLKKRTKKALSQVDWAISLSIFLLYIAWFFVFVKPLITPELDMSVMLDILEDGVRSEIDLDIYRVKVFIPDSVSLEREPVIIPFNRSWPQSSIAHTADYFAVDDSKLFFVANMSNTSFYDIYSSGLNGDDEQGEGDDINNW